MSKLRLRIFDGTRQPFSTPANFLITITDGNQKELVRAYYPENDITFDLPFYNNFGDSYSVVVFEDGFQQAGFAPVKLSSQYLKILDIMLVAKDPGFNFASATWNDAKSLYPYLGSDVDNATGEARYSDLLDKSEKSLASLLNLGEAMSQIHLAQGTPLDYIKQLRWDPPVRSRAGPLLCVVRPSTDRSGQGCR